MQIISDFVFPLPSLGQFPKNNLLADYANLKEVVFKQTVDPLGELRLGKIRLGELA